MTDATIHTPYADMTARKPKHAMPPSEKIVLRIVLNAVTPLHVRCIAKASGYTQGTTAALLRRLRDRGWVGPTRTGAGARWTTAEAARVERERDIAEREQHLTASTKRRAERRAERLPIAEAARAKRSVDRAVEIANEAWANEAPIRRIVPANECLPLRLSAVSSVFALGQP